MKKKTIWLITIVLALAFCGFIAIQVSYLQETIEIRRDQFDETVKRGLWRIAREMERAETATYLEENFNETQRQLLESLSHDDEYGNPTLGQNNKITLKGPDGSVSTFEFTGNAPDSLHISPFRLSKKHDHGSIQNSQRAMQEMLMDQYIYQKNLLDDVIFRILSQANDKPIMERMDINNLLITIDQEFEGMGIFLDYEFCIIDKDAQIVFDTNNFSTKEAEKSGIFLQPLFNNNVSSRVSYIEIYFPERNNFLFQSGLQFMIPSFVFSVIMLVLFTFVIAVVFRQKKLSEIKNDFINNMTHEFKTPISTISLASQMLTDPAVNKSQAMLDHVSGVIADETKRLRFQVEKVLQMSMFDRQKTNLKLSDLPVNEIVNTVINTFTLKVEKAGGRIEAHLDAEDDICVIDEMHFTNVIFNLLDNAYKYARENVPLHLIVSTRNVGKDKLEIRVQDNGIGIKADNLKKIFEKFYRVPTGNV
ncbi:MAG: HAMP domain-containing histidine kinase, partial [Bacteroidales bacterium]|nr:HAMP domain-containing histidine kinase [Bacteroidales bacterium]